MDQAKKNLIAAEAKALTLFQEIEKQVLIRAGISEEELNKEVFELAFSLFGIEKYWHKRIIRAGKNTLLPYNENPTNLMIQENDILFFDFGPIFDEWEADFGRTYVLGADAEKLKLQADLAPVWEECKAFFDSKTSLTGAAYYHEIVRIAERYGWLFGSEIGGHIIGKFPHERLEKEVKDHYIHRDNHTDLFAPDQTGKPRNWILEIHLINPKREFGGFFEQLLTV